MFPSGQLDVFSLFYALGFFPWLNLLTASLSVCGFKANLLSDCSFLLPSVLVLPTLVYLNSFFLCHHHCVTPQREMATCFIMKWVSFSWKCLNGHYFCLTPRWPVNMIPLPTHCSCRTSNIYTIQPIYPIESVHLSDHTSAVDLEPPGPMVFVHIRRVSCMMFSRPMWAIFSLFHWMRGTHCVASGRTRLKPLTTWSPFDIFPVFVWDPRLME